MSDKPDWIKWNEQHKKALEAARAAQEARKQLDEVLEVEAEKAV